MSENSRKKIETVLSNHIPEREVSFLLENAFKAEFKSKDIIINEGEHPYELFLTIKGYAYVQKQAFDGRRVVLSFLGPGRIIGDFSIFVNRRRSASVVALTHLECIKFNGLNLDNICELAPSFAKFIMRQHIFSIIAFDDRLVALSDNDISARIENLREHLKISIENFSGNFQKLPFKLSQEMMADFCGTSRETVSRYLNK